MHWFVLSSWQYSHIILSTLCVSIKQRDTNQTYAQRHNGRSYNSGSNSGSGGRKLGANIKGLDQLGAAKCAVGGG